MNGETDKEKEKEKSVGAFATFNQATKAAVLAAKPASDCCRRAHLLGLLLFGQAFSTREIRLASENGQIIGQAVSLLKSVVGVDVKNCVESFSNKEKLVVRDREVCEEILRCFGYEDLPSAYTIKDEVFVCDKCRSEFLKGVFLACGNVSSPEKRYHLELICTYFNLSRELLYFLKQSALEAKYTRRNSHYVIYYKESEKILDFLATIGAVQENFEYNNALIEKDIRNTINRLNNCETANLSKQIAAAARQLEAIRALFAGGEGKNAAGGLPEELLETAQLRLDYPDASLSQLAALHHPPVTKSCVNRRLKKLSALSSKKMPQ